MSVYLSDLIDDLKAAVAPLNDVPSDKQYSNAVRDAVNQFARRAPNRKMTTVNVVSGTAQYALPADFLGVIKYAPLGQGSVLLTDTGIVPLASGFTENWMIVGTTLTIDPTPTYTLARKLLYKAGFVLTADEYTDMTEEIAGIVLLRAQVLALEAKGNSVAESSWSYSIGDESFKKENVAAAVQKQTGDLQQQYEEALRSYIGTHTQQAAYASNEFGSFAPAYANPFVR